MADGKNFWYEAGANKSSSAASYKGSGYSFTRSSWSNTDGKVTEAAKPEDMSYISARSYMKSIADSGIKDVGSWKDLLQEQNTAGGILTLTDNLADANYSQFVAMQRMKYGTINPNSEVGKRLSSISANRNPSEMNKFTSIISKLSETNKLTDLLIGKSGTNGYTIGYSVTQIIESIFSNKSANDKNAAGGSLTFSSDKNTSGDFADTLFSEIKTTEEKYKNESGGFWGTLTELATKAAKKTEEVITYAGETLEQWYNTNIKDKTAFEQVKNVLGAGLSFPGVLQVANYVSGKFISYCLGMSQMAGIDGGLAVANIRNRILNLPPAMNGIIDPNGRCYNNNVLAPLHVCTIIPGMLDYNGFKFFADFGISRAAVATELKAFEDGNEGSIILDATSALASIVDISDRLEHPIGEFRPQTWQYLRVVSTILGRLVSRVIPESSLAMSLGDKTQLKTTGWGGIEFALGPNTTVTENGSNTFGETVFANIVGQGSGTARMLKHLKQEVLGGSDNETTSGGLVSAVLNGFQVNTPRFWESSNFSKSYTLTFRLESPYGDTQSIINYVYRPFAALLAVSLPIYKSLYGFSSPFMIRVDCPGWFTVNTGYVTSIDFRRAPDEGTWSSHGLATAIEVTMSIEDIYNALALSVGPVSLSRNFQQASFLDSMAGMDYKEIYSGGSMAVKLRERIIAARSLPDLAVQDFAAKSSKFLWGIGSGTI